MKLKLEWDTLAVCGLTAFMGVMMSAYLSAHRHVFRAIPKSDKYSGIHSKVIHVGGVTNAPMYHDQAAPGYSIVCDTELGLFAPMDSSGSIYYAGRHKTKQAAIEHSWWLFERRNASQTETDRYNWTDCDDKAKP